MRKLILLLALFPALAGAAETAQQALAKLPPLPKTATPTLDCSADEQTQKKIQAQLPVASAQMGAYGASAVNMTPAQMQAMQAMGDPAFNDCLYQLQSNPAETWVAPMKEQLDAKMQSLQGDYIKANEAFCGKQKGEGCIGDPSIDKAYHARAMATATQFLNDARPGYDKYVKDTGECVAKREKALGGASGGGNPALDAIFASTAGMTWSLLAMPAAANSSLCKAAREAASKYVSAP